MKLKALTEIIMSINWNNIRPLNNSQNDGFEELVCQLARVEDIKNRKTYIRKGKPDAGVECLWVLNNNEEWAWQAKFFTSSLEVSQWNQLDDSVKTTLEKHLNLKKYHIAIPIDPPDARLKNQISFLEKWNKRVTKWNNWSKEKGMDVEFIPWWSSDLINRLQKPPNVGLTYFWFNKEEFSDDWFKFQTELAISDLGKRYTPELNVELEISKIFSGISRDKTFCQDVNKLFHELIIESKQAIPKTNELKTEKESLIKLAVSLSSLFTSTEFSGINPIQVDQLQGLTKDAEQLSDKIRSFYIAEEDKLADKKDQQRFYKKYTWEIHQLNKFDTAVYNFKRFFDGFRIKLANQPFLIVEGEAGIGKSHLLADVVSKRNAMGLLTLFFLGQHFVTEEDPWTQIFKKNKIRCSIDEFLGAINAKAQLSRNRALFIIDAVNEGKGKYFWKSNIKSFLLQVRRYEWLGVVFSIRSSYSELIFPREELMDDLIHRYRHYGFRFQEYEATKIFFANYEIALPEIPLLHPEFQNPLFLRLFCEALFKAGEKRIPDGFQGISSIIDLFLNSINNKLSEPIRLNYSKGINIVKEAVDQIISLRIENRLQPVSYQKAFKLLHRFSQEYGLKPGLLEELISEGVFSKNIFWTEKGKDEEGIYLAYERFEDHLLGSFLISKYPNLKEAFSKSGELYHLIEDENKCFLNKGLIDALSIQIPEKCNFELHELVPSLSSSFPLVESFVLSLIWRKKETITENLKDYINTAVFQYQESFELFWDTVLTVSSIPGVG